MKTIRVKAVYNVHKTLRVEVDDGLSPDDWSDPNYWGDIISEQDNDCQLHDVEHVTLADDDCEA